MILLHPDDLQQLGIVHNQPVDVVSATGRLSGILARAYPEILPGNALMYYPEANVLVARHADPMSRTPAFKNVVVTVSAQPSPHSP